MGASSSASLVQESALPTTYDKHQVILKQEMDRRGIRHFDIPSRWSSRRVRGHGGAQCDCGRKWTSHQASAKIDLKTLAIKVWRQKCQDCNRIVKMNFRVDEFRTIINIMLDRLERQMNGEINLSYYDASPGGRGPPHRKELCEGCDWGSGDCRASSSRGKHDDYSLEAASGSNNGGYSSGRRDDDSGLGTAGTVAVVGAVAAGAALLGAAWAWASSSEEEGKGGEKK